MWPFGGTCSLFGGARVSLYAFFDFACLSFPKTRSSEDSCRLASAPFLAFSAEGSPI